MSRLDKKCLLASTVMHGFLVLLAAFGSAFFTPKPKLPPLSQLKFVPSKLLDDALAGGGGNPNLPRTDDVQKGDTLTPQPAAPAPVVQQPKPPQPQPPQPRPQPPPTPPKPEVKKQVAKVEPKKPDPVPPKKTPTPKPVDIAKATPKDPKPADVKPPEPSLNDLVKPVVRKNEDKAKARAEAEARAKAEAEAREAREAAQAEADYRSRVANALGKTALGLREGFASGTKVDVGGPGGAAYADYRQFVQAVYQEMWERLLPQEVLSEDTSALVSVTLSRSGRVISSRILRRSGSSSIDRVVQRTLDRVNFVRPFPEAAKDEQREFTLEFTFRNRRSAG